MKNMHPEIFKMQNGGFKAVFWGRHPDHIMDWRGTNYRYVVIKGQPKKGFATPEEARDFVINLPEAQWRAERDRAWGVTGTHFGSDYATNDPDIADVAVNRVLMTEEEKKEREEARAAYRASLSKIEL
jgi:hypothetical protein